MTLDEAIIRCEEIANYQEHDAETWEMSSKHWGDDKQSALDNADECKKCAEEHRQLAEWLKDYKRLLEKEDTLSNIKCSTCKYNETSEKCDKCYLYSEWRKVNEID